MIKDSPKSPEFLGKSGSNTQGGQASAQAEVAFVIHDGPVVLDLAVVTCLWVGLTCLELVAQITNSDLW